MELTVLCEGRTELNFVTGTLSPYLRGLGVFAKPQLLKPGGGVVAFGKFSAEIKQPLGKSRVHQCWTTMLDLYALPDDYPCRERLAVETGASHASRIEAGMRTALPSPRFLPYIQVHEFEALIYAGLDQLASAFPDGEALDAAEHLRTEARGMAPEDVDDGPETAPSKRLVRVVPAYAAMKPVAGPQIARRIGLSSLRGACPHFDEWLTQLEGLGRSRQGPTE